MVNEVLQHLIIDALMINVTFTDSQESKWENLYTNIPHRSIAQIGAISRIHNVWETWYMSITFHSSRVFGDFKKAVQEVNF